MNCTPGPWTFSDRDFRNQVDTSGCLYVTGDAHEDEDGGMVATSVAKVIGNATCGTIASDNARLIAAAPDLLAVCKAVVEEDGFRGSAMMRKRIDAMKAAIAKAEGR